jgi:hypothetical protein
MSREDDVVRHSEGPFASPMTLRFGTLEVEFWPADADDGELEVTAGEEKMILAPAEVQLLSTFLAQVVARQAAL